MYSFERNVHFHPSVHGHSKQLEAFHIYLVVVKVKLFIIRHLNLVIVHEEYTYCLPSATYLANSVIQLPCPDNHFHLEDVAFRNTLFY